MDSSGKMFWSFQFSARDFLDALVSLKFLERRDGRYYNTPSADFFLDKRKPSYIGCIRSGAASPRRSERDY
jgi:hypothetical protein